MRCYWVWNHWLWLCVMEFTVRAVRHQVCMVLQCTIAVTGAVCPKISGPRTTKKGAGLSAKNLVNGVRYRAVRVDNN